MHFRQSYRYLVATLGMLALLLANSASAQFDLDDFKLAPELTGLSSGPPDPELQVTANVRVAPGSNIGMLEVTATMNDGWHVYALTQPSGGPTKTTIQIDESADYKLLGSLAPKQAPYVHFVDVFNMDVEELAGTVTWIVPIEVTGNAANLKVSGFVEGQVCADGGACVPFEEEDTHFVATLNGELQPAELSTLRSKRLPNTHADLRGWLSTNEAKPGDTINMYVAFDPETKWHVYAYAPKPPSMFQRPTLVQATLPEGWTLGKVRSASPIISEAGLAGDPPIRYYDGAATIAFPIKIPETAQPGDFPLSGHIGYQTCSTQCDRPTAIAWTSKINVTASPKENSSLGVVDFQSEASDYDAVLKLLDSSTTTGAPGESSTGVADNTKNGGNAAITPVEGAPVADSSVSDLDFGSVDSTADTSFGTVLMWAFIGGFVLNFMPCVLPVIGLKIMSFVDQAGSSRAKAFTLNAYYALGILAIFWILAALAAAPALGLNENGLGWGEQFNYQWFAITLVCVIFVMALSFLGVWEIPIPGFATSHTASELTEKEGFSGAFFKGAITTILATPCSAPGLGTAYAFSVNSGSPTTPFLIFTVMGLGMAAPFLLIGVFPSLIRFLPKPGAWMDTFKQILGFVLLGTVVFLLQNVSFPNLLPTIGFCFGLWFACWWIGRVPLTAPSNDRMRAWGVATIIGLLALVISFGRHIDAFDRSFHGLLGTSELKFDSAVARLLNQSADSSPTTKVAHSANSLKWEPFRMSRVDELVSNNETVLIDFTATWCLSCRTLEHTVLNTRPVKDLVEQNGVRALKADWSTRDPEIGKLLDQLQGAQRIPFLVIFPAGRPQDAIRFSDFWTRDQVLKALEDAGPSKPKRKTTQPVDVVSKPGPEPAKPLIITKLP